MPRLRTRIITARSYNPQWDGFIEGYVTNYLHQNYWRVQHYMEYEDVVQEARVVFYRVKNKYGKLEHPKHFMALFKTSWVREFTDLANAATKVSEASYEMGNTEQDEFMDVLCGDLENDGMLSIMMQQAPEEVKKVLKLFLTTPVEALNQMSMVWKWRGKNIEFGNQHLCEILKLKEGTDVLGKIKEYFA
jgi:hypothetical protein